MMASPSSTMVTPGFSDSREAWSMVVPGTRVPAPVAGTVAGML